MLERLQDFGETLSRFTERWVPDAWVVCLGLTAISFALAILGAGAGVEEAALAWGSGLWRLLELAMQFSLAMIAAYAIATAKPVFRALDRVASIPNPERPRQALALAAMVSFVTAYLNWAVCLVGCAIFVPFLARRNPKADFRLLIAGAYLGLGTVWHCGLSGSGPLIMATPGNPLLAPKSGPPVVDRLYPITETLFNGFNLGYMFAIAAVGLGTLLAIHPRRNAHLLSAEQLEAILPKTPPEPPEATTPAARIESFRGWVWFAALLVLYPLGHSIATKGFGASWTINAYNAVFLSLAMLLHGRPIPFLEACKQGTQATWGIILQFPFYGGIFGLMTQTRLGDWLGSGFANVSSTASYPFVVYLYSAMMNLFVPSGGSKWMVEAPYLIPAGEALDVSVTTVLLAYAYGDSTTNLIQPFFAIPILTLTKTRFGEVVGYMAILAFACFLASTVAMLLMPPRL